MKETFNDSKPVIDLSIEDPPEPIHAQDWKKDLISILNSRHFRVTVAIMLVLVVLRLAVNAWLGHESVETIHVVKVSQLSFKTIDKTLTLPGNVEAIEQATLYAHVSGYLKKIMVDEGDEVKKNQLLATIDAPDITQEFRKAKAEFDFKETTRKRYQELLKEQVVSQQEYDKVEADANQSKARFDNADSNLQYTYVRAPFAGSIARRFKYPGDFISAPTKGGQASPLFLLVNEEQLRISVNAPQREIGNIVVGHLVDIRVDTFPDKKFGGEVSRIDALFDEATKTQRALIDIDNPDALLRAGMFASVVLHAEHRDGVPMVEKTAIHDDGDNSFVFVVRDGKAKKIAVRVGDASDGLIELKAPLIDRKDSIIVDGGAPLVDGDSVKVAGKS